MEVVAGGMRQTKAGTLVWVLIRNVVLSLLVFYLTRWNISDCLQAQTM